MTVLTQSSSIQKIPHRVSTVSRVVTKNSIRKREPTTWVEQGLLISTAVFLPLQGHIPDIGGFGFMWIVFGLLGCYVLLWRPHILKKTLVHPMFLMGFGFTYVAFLVEMTHPFPGYPEIFRLR